MARHGPAHGEIRDVSRERGASPGAYVDQQGAPHRHQGPTASPPAKGVVGRGEHGGKAKAAIDLMLGGEPAGRRPGARVVVEEFSRRRGSELHRHGGRRACPAACPPSQDHKRLKGRRPGAEHGRHGRPIRPHRWWTPGLAPARVMREIIQPAIAGMAQGWNPLYRLPVCRPDDRQRRAIRERSNSTAALGDPRDAADHAAAEIGPARARRAPRSRVRSTAPPPTGTARPAAGRWCWRPAVIRTSPRKGDEITSLPQGRPRIAACSMPAPALDGKRGW